MGRCHYCEESATTRDHIVSRYRLKKLRAMTDADHPMYQDFMLFCEANVVPSCEPCNQYKGNRDSGCPCDRCATAWGTYAWLLSYDDAQEPPPLTQTLGDFFPK